MSLDEFFRVALPFVFVVFCISVGIAALLGASGSVSDTPTLVWNPVLTDQETGD